MIQLGGKYEPIWRLLLIQYHFQWVKEVQNLTLLRRIYIWSQF